jgi:hypothetical protein
MLSDACCFLSDPPQTANWERSSSARLAWEYNDSNAKIIGDTAGGYLQLFADQSGVVRNGCGLEPSCMLPTERKSSLCDDDEPLGIFVRSFHAGWQMPFLSSHQGGAS